MIVIEGPYVPTEEPANVDCRRCLDLIETAFDIPCLEFLLEVFIVKDRLPKDIMTKVESNP